MLGDHHDGAWCVPQHVLAHLRGREDHEPGVELTRGLHQDTPRLARDSTDPDVIEFIVQGFRDRHAKRRYRCLVGVCHNGDEVAVMISRFLAGQPDGGQRFRQGVYFNYYGHSRPLPATDEICLAAGRFDRLPVGKGQEETKGEHHAQGTDQR
jgi:hypothetical protein